MLWPIVLPAKITFWVLSGLVAIIVTISPVFGLKRGMAALVAGILACVVFIPSCTAVMSIVDARRFGVFHYDTYAEVDDFRIERFLPPGARDITLDKFSMGHRARYSISESELRAYVDGLWQQYGEYSAIPRDELNDGSAVTYDDFGSWFDGLDWEPMETAIQFRSPVEEDGGGATYLFDVESEVVYHGAGYW